jgi:hypothetical protein
MCGLKKRAIMRAHHELLNTLGLANPPLDPKAFVTHYCHMFHSPKKWKRELHPSVSYSSIKDGFLIIICKNTFIVFRLSCSHDQLGLMHRM